MTIDIGPTIMPVAARVIPIIVWTLGTSTQACQPEALLDDLRADSLDRLCILMDLEDEFGILIADMECVEWRTVADVIATVERKL